MIDQNCDFSIDTVSIKPSCKYGSYVVSRSFMSFINEERKTWEQNQFKNTNFSWPLTQNWLTSLVFKSQDCHSLTAMYATVIFNNGIVISFKTLHCQYSFEQHSTWTQGKNSRFCPSRQESPIKIKLAWEH